MNEKELSSAKAETEKPSYWAVLPAAIRYDPEIPASAKLLYAEISSLTESRGFCYASNDYFVRLYGMAERTLQRHLKALEDAGYIRILDGNGGKARRRIFAGVNPLAGNPDKNDGVTPTNMSGSPDKNVTQNKKEIRKENDPPKAPQGADGEKKKSRRKTRAKAACDYEPEIFERFWKAYPRGEAKAEARYEWDELRPDRKLMYAMSAALERQKKSAEWLRDNGRAVPYACRWLKNLRWDDEMKDAPAPEPETERKRERT
jgi:DNA-binding transcriptional ArsR family regulator